MAVRPELSAICLCDGYGGFELGLREHGIRTVCRVERDSYAAAVLVARMEEQRLDQAPVWDDLTTFDGAAWRGRVDLITAGFPCQPFSAVGKRKGVDDDRWLWPAIRRIISDVGPRYVFLENVPGLVRAGLPHVLADLADLGFDAEWGLLSAAAVGAPHKRSRIWIVAALADTEGVDEREPHDTERTLARQDARPDIGRGGFPPRPDDTDAWQRWIAEGRPKPSIRRSTHGRPVGLADALHLGGNGLVPATASEAWRQLTERLKTL